jgi:hypothetical protein
MTYNSIFLKYKARREPIILWKRSDLDYYLQCFMPERWSIAERLNGVYDILRKGTNRTYNVFAMEYEDDTEAE